MLIRPVPANTHRVGVLVPEQKRFTTRRAYIPHAAWLGQGYPHCPIFLTAASRRSLVRVSVPVWGTVLSDPLPIVGSVGRRPADYLMGRMPVPDRLSALSTGGCPPGEPWRIIRRFHRLSACRGLVAYALRTRAPLSCLPKVAFPFDLHVLGLPLAFILSQDQTLRCTIVFLKFFFCISGSALMFSLVFLLIGSLPRAASRGAGLVLASDFQRTPLPDPLSSPSRSFRKRVQKYYLFPIPQAFFSTIFCFSYN